MQFRKTLEPFPAIYGLYNHICGGIIGCRSFQDTPFVTGKFDRMWYLEIAWRLFYGTYTTDYRSQSYYS